MNKLTLEDREKGRKGHFRVFGLTYMNDKAV